MHGGGEVLLFHQYPLSRLLRFATARAATGLAIAFPEVITSVTEEGLAPNTENQRAVATATDNRLLRLLTLHRVVPSVQRAVGEKSRPHCETGRYTRVSKSAFVH
jgi:hypothetical protein